jgi:hypothetical protein
MSYELQLSLRNPTFCHRTCCVTVFESILRLGDVIRQKLTAGVPWWVYTAKLPTIDFSGIFNQTRETSTIFKQHFYQVTSSTGPPLWSSCQSSWLQIRRPGFDSQHYQKKKCTQPREYKLRSYLIEK